MDNKNNSNSLQDAITAGIAATSNDPFKTAFKITLGIGMARLVIFLAVVSVVTGLVWLANN